MSHLYTGTMDLGTESTFGVIEKESFDRWLVPLAVLALAVTSLLSMTSPLRGTFTPEEVCGLTLFCVGALFLEWGRWLIAFSAGIALWVLGMLAFADFSLLVESGLGASDGRWVGRGVSPNAAVIIACLGLGLSVLSRRFRRRFQTVLGITCGGLGGVLALVALWGHINSIESAYKWARFSPMGIFAASLYLCGSVLLVYVGYSRGEPAGRPTARGLVIAVGFSSAIAVTLMIAALLGQRGEANIGLLWRDAGTIRHNLEAAEMGLEQLLSKVGEELSRKDNNSAARIATILKTHPEVRAVIVSTSVDSPPAVTPSVVSIDDVVWQSLRTGLSRGDNKRVSAIIERRDPQLLVAVREGQEVVYVGALLSPAELFPIVTAGLEPGRGVRMSYGGSEEFQRDYLANEPDLEYLDVPILLWGRPGWRLSLSTSGTGTPGVGLSALFKLPVSAFAGVLALVWGIFASVRARKAEALVREIERSIQEVGPVHERALSALDGVRDLVIFADSNERVLFMNQAARGMFQPKQKLEIYLSELLSLSTLEGMRGAGYVTARQRGSWSEIGVARTVEFGEVPVAVRLIAHNDSQGKEVVYSVVLTYFHHLRGDPATKVLSSIPGWLIAERIPVPLWFTDNQGKPEFANRAMLSLLRVSLEGFRSGWPDEFRHPDDALSGGQAHGLPVGSRRRLRTSEGRFVWIEESVVALQQPGAPEVSCHMGACVECGDERQLRQQLNLHEAVLDQIGSETSIAFWVHDTTNDKILVASPGFEQTLGVSTEELRLNPGAWRSIVPAATELPDALTSSVSVQYHLRRDDGSDIPVRHSMAPFVWDDGTKSINIIVHIVDLNSTLSQSVISKDENISVTRQLKIELNYLYSFLAARVVSGAQQIGSLGRFVVEDVRPHLSRESYADAAKLSREAERLVGYLRDCEEVAKVVRCDEKSNETTVAEALRSLLSSQHGLPAPISFTGDIEVNTGLALDTLVTVLRGIAIFAYERRGDVTAKEIRISVTRHTGGASLAFSLGMLPLSREELTRVFYPGADVTKDGYVLPSLAVVSAAARQHDGRVWVTRSTADGIQVHLSLRK